MSSIQTSKTRALRGAQKPEIRPLRSRKPDAGRASGSSAPAAQLTVSPELITDRLACILRQIQKGCARQLLLHTALLAGILKAGYPKAQTVRDMLHESLAWFIRGNRHRAEQRVQDAIETWSSGHRQAGRNKLSALRSRAARA